MKLVGANLDENDVLTQLFFALLERYDPLVTALQNVDDGKLSLSVVKERFFAEETNMKDRVSEKNLLEMSAFQGKKKFKFNGKCFKCEKGVHRAKVSKSDAKSSGFCFIADQDFCKRKK